MSGGPLTLGTAGHIDHGKTALIQALTGIDSDRLPEEQARGVSIELGYANLELPSGRRLSIVDVPGHERYVRTMVAGATGIDLYLMAIAADDGVMPQTREHAAVLRALGIDHGVVAVTKSDLADPEPASLEAAELLPGAELVAVSARHGNGLDALLAALDRVAAGLPGRSAAPGETRLHVDRVFSVRGAGTVVTGTLWSGQIARSDRLRLVPAGLRARAREVQVHDHAVDRAAAGQRVAVNLAGLGHDEVRRGDLLTQEGTQLEETFLIDAELSFASRRSEPDTGARVHVHHGTRETPARLAWLGGAFWQLRLERPLIAVEGDRLVVRQIAPPDTLGGGRVLDAHPRRHGPGRELLARLTRLARGEPDPVRETIAPTPEPAPTPLTLSASALALEARLREAGFEPPPDGELDRDDLAALRRAGRAVRISRTLHFHADAAAEVRRRVLALAAEHGGAVTLAQLRDALGTSRKFAQAVLEHLDGERVTIRRGDEHVVRRQHREA
ncbi:MAG: selenocysteine-specific elongation factor [Solirubrobacteraceae bacterium]|jgi:selenocysteine-specific elongation factor|nr:selenocysteine-specific elongation factor [Solirubrobacteraceae bacterium]